MTCATPWTRASRARSSSSPASTKLAVHAPVLVIVDELGKNLDYAAERPSDGDLYVLQRLAERFSDPRPL